MIRAYHHTESSYLLLYEPPFPVVHCIYRNYFVCSPFQFSLVCDKSHIPSTTMSVQMGGVLLGNMASGQIATLYGRKWPLYSSMVILVVSDFIAYFSINWIMFMVVRFFIGIGCGFFLATQFSLLSEFTLAKWRAWTIGFPSWPLERCILAAVGWLLNDWRNLQLTIALAGIPFLATLW